jgi:hypothetical protein
VLRQQLEPRQQLELPQPQVLLLQERQLQAAQSTSSNQSMRMQKQQPSMRTCYGTFFSPLNERFISILFEICFV